MDNYFGWLGFLALAIVLCYMPNITKVTKLEQKVNKLRNSINKVKGENEMSKLIEELVGKKCSLKVDESWDLVGSGLLMCDIISADEEWVKLTYEDKKKNMHTALIRIDSIKGVEIMEKQSL